MLDEGKTLARKRMDHGLDPLNAMTITMTGTRPTFYLVPVIGKLKMPSSLANIPLPKLESCDVRPYQRTHYTACQNW